uniref:F-box domain-containing protein n=1 Tax=Fusarium oxysporum (strain Fo5176) TaxID=660025 RepID=A0A0D2YK43_FUSOF
MQTISTNQNITNLKISNLIPRNASAWETPEWESFLGRLQVLEIGVFGGEDGDCWHTKPEFAEFIGNLPHFVMRHARNVRHLTLEASPDGLFGGASTNYCIPLPLKEDHFLFLHSLTLKNIMIGPELVEFLTSRVDSFEELELYDYPVTWAGLWKAIRESNIRLFKVKEFETIEDSVEAARIRKMLEEDTLLCRRLEANAEYKAVELAW